MKISLEAARASLTSEQLESNLAQSKDRRRAVARPDLPPLAIVGGGPSLLDRLGELRAWRGDIWAINKTFCWLRDNGITSRFYTADPKPFPDGIDIRSGDEVLIGAHSFPELFDQVKAGNVEVFQHGAETGIVPAGTSAGTAATIGLVLGHPSITFFGCESSYGDISHVYRSDETLKDMLRVRCNGKSFLTKPEFVLQATILSEMLRQFPRLYRERSGGLLAAMVSDPDYDVTHGMPGIHAAIMEQPHA